MSRPCPARRIPQVMVLIGFAFMAGAIGVAVGHFGFGVPVYDRNTDQPSSDSAIAVIVFAFGGSGVLLALAGRAVLRAASRRHSKRTFNANGS